jgi:hypothetical protein
MATEYIIYTLLSAIILGIFSGMFDFLLPIKRIKKYLRKHRKPISTILILFLTAFSIIIFLLYLIITSTVYYSGWQCLIVIILSFFALFYLLRFCSRFFKFIYLIYLATKNTDIDELENKN